jgi:hypothetical protein
VTFSPDHVSKLYEDQLNLDFKSDGNSRTIGLFGICRKSLIYIRGVEELENNMKDESMILNELETRFNDANVKGDKSEKLDLTAIMATNVAVNAIPILVTLYSNSKSINEFVQAEKVIYIGCIKTDRKDLKKVALEFRNEFKFLS